VKILICFVYFNIYILLILRSLPARSRRGVFSRRDSRGSGKIYELNRIKTPKELAMRGRNGEYIYPVKESFRKEATN